MKRKIIIIGILSLLLSTSMISAVPIIKQHESKPVDRGIFEADLGMRNESDPMFILEGNYRDFRRGHVLFGTINYIDSDYSNRFQGFATRNRFIIQTAIRGNIVNIVGLFNSYNEDTEEFSGTWGGMIAGRGRTRGWITAQFT